VLSPSRNRRTSSCFWLSMSLPVAIERFGHDLPF
jgi:hypothetical protein